MNYNTKEKRIIHYSCANEYPSEKKECHKNWLYRTTL